MSGRKLEHKKTKMTARANGRPLPRSVTKGYQLSPEDCNHPKLIARGSASLKWMTCTNCGSRWERLDRVGEQRSTEVDLRTETAETCQCGQPMRLKAIREDDSRLVECTDFLFECTDFPRCRRTREYQLKGASPPQESSREASSSAGPLPPAQQAARPGVSADASRGTSSSAGPLPPSLQTAGQGVPASRHELEAIAVDDEEMMDVIPEPGPVTVLRELLEGGMNREAALRFMLRAELGPEEAANLNQQTRQ